jgi:hypothetical protein
MTKDRTDLNVEVGLRVQCQSVNKTDIKFFTAPLGKINVLFFPFVLYNDIMTNEESAMTFFSSIEIVIKLPNDFNSSITTMPFYEVEFNDVEIICENQTFKCHKFMLALKSDVFKAMLMTSECTEKITGTVRVDDINAKTMNTLLKYMYQNTVRIKYKIDNITKIQNVCYHILYFTILLLGIIQNVW